MSTATESERKMLEFTLGGKQYCVDLEYVDEIVTNEDKITEIPNSDRDVIGVMDLRGRTARIVDPRISLDLPSKTEPKYVIVFESDDQPTGWLIEDVTQVVGVTEDSLDDSVANGSVEGVFKQGDEFTVCIDPGSINS